MPATVTLDVVGWLGELQTDLDAALADLLQICRASGTKTYAETVSEHQVGIATVILENADGLGETAPERAARNCFLNAIGKFISFLDKLIANQRMVTDGVVITRTLVGEEEVKAYVNEYLGDQITKVARDRSLSNPKKMACFQVTDLVQTTALAYFELRRTLEHHQDTPQQDLEVPIMRIAFFADDKEIVEIPAVLQPGQGMEMRTLIDRNIYQAGKKIILTPEVAQGLVFTLRNVLAPEVFQASVASDKP